MSSRNVTRTGSADQRQRLLGEIVTAARALVSGGILFHQALAERLELNASDLQCLGVLQSSGPITAGELALRTGLTTGGVTRVVDRLERTGFVERQADRRDRRRVLVAPVQERMQDVSALYGPVSRAWSALLEDYNDDELQMVLELFDKMQRLTAEQIRNLHESRA